MHIFESFWVLIGYGVGLLTLWCLREILFSGGLLRDSKEREGQEEIAELHRRTLNDERKLRRLEEIVLELHGKHAKALETKNSSLQKALELHQETIATLKEAKREKEHFSELQIEVSSLRKASEFQQEAIATLTEETKRQKEEISSLRKASEFQQKTIANVAKGLEGTKKSEGTPTRPEDRLCAGSALWRN